MIANWGERETFLPSGRPACLPRD